MPINDSNKFIFPGKFVGRTVAVTHYVDGERRKPMAYRQVTKVDIADRETVDGDEHARVILTLNEPVIIPTKQSVAGCGAILLTQANSLDWIMGMPIDLNGKVERSALVLLDLLPL